MVKEKVKIRFIKKKSQKTECAAKILQALPEWFNDASANEKYIEELKSLPFWGAFNEKNECVGFFSVKIHFGQTGEILVCGVLSEYQGNKVGSELYSQVEAYLKKNKCQYCVVKTLSDSVAYEPYEKTRKFYSSRGFEKLMVFDDYWAPDSPCLIMIKSL